jgi:hypothetical protein
MSLFQPAIIIWFSAAEEWSRISQKGRQVYDNDCFTLVPCSRVARPAFQSLAKPKSKPDSAVPLLVLALYIVEYDYVATLLYSLSSISLFFLPVILQSCHPLFICFSSLNICLIILYFYKIKCLYVFFIPIPDRLCGLVGRVPGYRSRGPVSIPGTIRFSEK